MKPNMGNTDRIIRFVVGAILVLIGLLVPMSSLALQIILIVLGAILLVTAAIRFCPIYVPFKFNTLKK